MFADMRQVLNLLTVLFILSPFGIQAQEKAAQDIDSVYVNLYFNPQLLLSSPSSGKSISQSSLASQQPGQLSTVVNTVPGVRMEERSPGSYRFTLRGSTIRSPFGVRNLKVYWGDIPLTDAGGNTYLNLIAPSFLETIEILKGPDASVYGPNSAGVIRLIPRGSSYQQGGNQVDLQLSGGSFGRFDQQAYLSYSPSDKYHFSMGQVFNRADNYRDQSALNQKSFYTFHQWDPSLNHSFKMHLLLSDMHYETPGGLTLEQMKENPKGSRPASGNNPSAKEQHAGTYNKTILGGLTHQMTLLPNLSLNNSIFSSYTDFRNPFITNYEYRFENNLGVRAYLNYQKSLSCEYSLDAHAGIEGQWANHQIRNQDNENGTPTGLQTEDKLGNHIFNTFVKMTLNKHDLWSLEASLGHNNHGLYFSQQYPEEIGKTNITLKDNWMPRLAYSYRVHPQHALRLSVSKGFSLPTLAEVRSSDQKINTDLKAEQGINYEVGWRWHNANQRVRTDLSAYYYLLNDGIVRSIDENGNDYYQNAGEIEQKAIELNTLLQLIKPKDSGFLQSINWDMGLTLQDFKFKSYQIAGEDYDNNRVTSTPGTTISNTLSIRSNNNWQLNILHYYSSDIPLDDANTVFAESYNLLQAKLLRQLPLAKGKQLTVFAGADNLLNQKYSMGNDINAFGGRFFNPAPSRNFYAGLSLLIK